MQNPFDYLDPEDDDGDDQPEYDLGIPERFDPGYHGDWTQLPRICCECGKTFRLSDSGRAASGATRATGATGAAGRESVLDDYCYECLGELFERLAAEGREQEQIAKRLGMTIEEFLGME